MPDSTERDPMERLKALQEVLAHPQPALLPPYVFESKADPRAYFLSTLAEPTCQPRCATPKVQCSYPGLVT